MTVLPVPPASLRAGIGPFEDPDHFLQSGRETLDRATRLSGIGPDNRILDVGCGCGRFALALLDWLGPKGRYEGFDVASDCVEWCIGHIEAKDTQLAFEKLEVQSGIYNANGSALADDVVFPYGDASPFDLALVSSAFTHMEEAGIERYLSELGRVMAASGVLMVSLLLMDAAAVKAVG